MPGTIPDALSLDRYTGPFGIEEARTLYNRAAYGYSEAELQRAVADGMEATVTRLMTWEDKSDILAHGDNYMCLRGTFVPDCDPNNPWDRYWAIYDRVMLHWITDPRGRYFTRMMMFLGDDRIAVNSGIASVTFNWYSFVLPGYYDILRRAAQSGDYRTYATDITLDPLAHLIWLDGQSNIGDAPNENMARELLEILTIGSSDLEGNPRYGDADIAQGALALSGWIFDWSQAQRFNQSGFVPTRFVPERHRAGPKTIFIGTPQQRVVYDALDLIEAALDHPGTAESLAKNLWHQFINPHPTVDALRQLASILRAHNLNLNRAMEVILRSKAFYAAASRRSLLKDPLDLMFGVRRLSGTDLPALPESEDIFSFALGSYTPFRAPTVFGWNERALSDEYHQHQWNVSAFRHALRDENISVTAQRLRERFLSGISAGPEAAAAVVDRLARAFGTTLQPAQRQIIIDYLSTRRVTITCADPQATEICYRTEPFNFDVTLSDNRSVYKLLSLLNLIAAMPENRLK